MKFNKYRALALITLFSLPTFVFAETWNTIQSTPACFGVLVVKSGKAPGPILLSGSLTCANEVFSESATAYINGDNVTVNEQTSDGNICNVNAIKRGQNMNGTMTCASGPGIRPWLAVISSGGAIK